MKKVYKIIIGEEVLLQGKDFKEVNIYPPDVEGDYWEFDFIGGDPWSRIIATGEIAVFYLEETEKESEKC